MGMRVSRGRPTGECDSFKGRPKNHYLAPRHPAGAVECKNEDLVDDLWWIDLYVKQLPILRWHIGQPCKEGPTSGPIAQPYLVRRGTCRRLCNLQLDSIDQVEPVKSNGEPLRCRLL